jgi:hypothetical protein
LPTAPRAALAGVVLFAADICLISLPPDPGRWALAEAVLAVLLAALTAVAGIFASIRILAYGRSR